MILVRGDKTMNTYSENDYREYLEHSSKGKKWKNHKYLYITPEGRYVYPEDTKNHGGGKSTVNTTRYGEYVLNPDGVGLARYEIVENKSGGSSRKLGSPSAKSIKSLAKKTASKKANKELSKRLFGVESQDIVSTKTIKPGEKTTSQKAAIRKDKDSIKKAAKKILGVTGLGSLTRNIDKMNEYSSKSSSKRAGQRAQKYLDDFYKSSSSKSKKKKH